ncbi:hypothetical protein M3O96_14925 [Aquiflexum sp. TKW24L]|uniref:hypothetical protein n=1 Tax=Aquiflexum sp. TKW24L TaxID=2942212 RepID=UPI0020C09A88|nr:hypothetical protein [Aquiflexum sp. TKW24L]MCL6260393.1 hypothetical protein [Aquiflexum sp. TKW24L]
MKKHLLSLITLVVITVGCNKESNEPVSILIGNWELVETFVSWPPLYPDNPELDSDYKVTYRFDTDGTFTKTETSDGFSTLPVQALGRYEIGNSTQSDFLLEVVLTFDSNPELAANCDFGMENLYISNEKLLVNTSWSACDGPGFIFRKI